MVESALQPPPGCRTRYLQCAGMCLCNIVIFVLRSSLGVAILAMTDRSKVDGNFEIYDWSETLRGVILSSFFWGYTIMQVPFGMISKKYGGKPPLMAALIINGILCLLTPTLAKLGGWVAMCVVRGCMGLTQSCFKPSNHTLIGKWVPPHEKNRIAILVYAGMMLGTVISMPFCGLLANTSMGWPLIFYAMGALSLITSVIYWFITASSPAEHRFIKDAEVLYLESVIGTSSKEEIPVPWKQIFTSVPVYALTMTHIGLNWCLMLYSNELPAYLSQGLNISIEKGSTLSSLPFIAQWILTLITSCIADYINNKKILRSSTSRKMFQGIGCFSVALGFVILTFLDKKNVTLIIVVITISMGLVGCSSCGYMLTHIDMSPNFGGILYGLTNCMANFVGILTPISVGWILGDQPTDLARWRIVFYIAAAITTSTTIIFIIFGNAERQPWDNLRKYSQCYSHLGSIKVKTDILIKEKEELLKINESNTDEKEVEKVL